MLKFGSDMEKASSGILLDFFQFIDEEGPLFAKLLQNDSSYNCYKSVVKIVIHFVT